MQTPAAASTCFSPAPTCFCLHPCAGQAAGAPSRQPGSSSCSSSSRRLDLCLPLTHSQRLAGAMCHLRGPPCPSRCRAAPMPPRFLRGSWVLCQAALTPAAGTSACPGSRRTLTHWSWSRLCRSSSSSSQPAGRAAFSRQRRQQQRQQTTRRQCGPAATARRPCAGPRQRPGTAVRAAAPQVGAAVGQVLEAVGGERPRQGPAGRQQDVCMAAPLAHTQCTRQTWLPASQAGSRARSRRSSTPCSSQTGSPRCCSRQRHSSSSSRPAGTCLAAAAAAWLLVFKRLSPALGCPQPWS